jgi:hypothetical protein
MYRKLPTTQFLSTFRSAFDVTNALTITIGI